MGKDRDWKEEQETVLGRLFNALFGRSNATEEDVHRDIHWLGTVNKHLNDDDD
ncbi:MAG: hypothetical protein KGQ47_00635 [Hyphomicrobiales bacterium]|nr:hypothetical protein [Hyphomicrobiales bacterium]MDE2373244.1 hypothetical protein [Hyphomicrobiales bacterium]